jgi:hypothetical protein
MRTNRLSRLLAAAAACLGGRQLLHTVCANRPGRPGAVNDRKDVA